MINVIASIEINADCLNEFLEIFKSNVPNVLAESGCIEYMPTIDVETSIPSQKLNANIVTVIEKWASLECLEAHLSAPHMIDYKAKVIDLVSSVSLKILREI